MDKDDVVFSRMINRSRRSEFEQTKLNDDLCRAAEGGNMAEVIRCLDAGADIHFRADYAFHWAVGNHHADVVDALLSYGADRNAWEGNIWEMFTTADDWQMRHVYQKWEIRRKPIELPLQVWQGKSVFELEEIVPEYGESGIVLLARADKFDHVLNLLREENLCKFLPCYLRMQGRYGNSVLNILAERKKLSGVLQENYWQGREDILRGLYKNDLDKCYKDGLSINSLLKNFNLKSKARKERKRILNKLRCPAPQARRRPKTP